ncbi:hypothetical protein P7C73_g3673, partial [Tremellales sp. Uapishka_1]
MHSRANSVTIVSATDPNEKVTVDIPRPGTAAYQGLAGVPPPTWKSSTRKPPVGGGPSGSKRKKLDREKIVNGFDSDSSSGAGEGRGDESVEKEDDEIDELASEDGRQSRGKRSALDDDVSGELLELASGPAKKPPAKRSKPAPHPPPSLQVPTMNGRPIIPPHRAPRHSLPVSFQIQHPTVLPTPVTPSASEPFHPYSGTIASILVYLPSLGTQRILFKNFWSDPYFAEGISLLQMSLETELSGVLERRLSRFKPGDATIVANAFAILAATVRALPEDTGKLIMSSAALESTGDAWSPHNSVSPKSFGRLVAQLPATTTDATCLDQRYFDLSQIASQLADQEDAISPMTVMHRLVVHRYLLTASTSLQTNPLSLAADWLAQGIKIAQYQDLNKEFEGFPTSERELRRRLMWSLYIADRHLSFITLKPYTIMEGHQSIHLPSPMADQDLLRIQDPNTQLPQCLIDNNPTPCTAMFIHTHLTRRLVPVLDNFATIGASKIALELVFSFDASLLSFLDTLPKYFRLYPSTDTRFDGSHPYIIPHRIRLHDHFLTYRIMAHRYHLRTYLHPLLPHSRPEYRERCAGLHLAALRVQRSAKMLDSKTATRVLRPHSIFEYGATLGLIAYVEKALLVASGRAMSKEYFTMRGGVAEAIELLDSISPTHESAQWIQVPLHILKQILNTLDAPSRRPFTPSTNGNSHPRTNGNAEHDYRPTSRGSNGTVPGPIAIAENDPTPVPKSEPNPSPPPRRSQSPVPPPSSSAAQPTYPPLLLHVTHWLESWATKDLEMILYKTPVWQGMWEVIIGGMVV